jgi:glycosyltransferase involved in cell wall biosynthesis
MLKLVIVHHHFRPGGVRRVIELATPHLVTHWPQRVRAVVLATGETPAPDWLRSFRQRLHGTPVKVIVQPAFGYVSEVPEDGKRLKRRVQVAIAELLREAAQDDCLIWAHNLGLGRNLYLARELTFACHSGGIPLIAHHHDWWFENRWHHFTAMRKSGFRTLPGMASAILAGSPLISHASINQADATVLQKHFPGLSGWLPNPVEPAEEPPAARVQAARAWLCDQLGENAPVWLLPCRLLRRKNIAEALLLTRWLRPEAWLVTTGGVSSAQEQAYAATLAAAAQTHGWRLRLGSLQGDENQKPTVPELLAASEAVLLTSLQEGFGLPFLEAAAARRPLVARELPNIAPDLARFGFKFPQCYQEMQVDSSLFDWRAERKRQQQLFAEWKSFMPRAANRLAGKPAVLVAGKEPRSVPFSRLTLTAQLEVLAQPAVQSWERCAPLNPFLKTWRSRVAAGKLQASLWPRSAARWLSGRAYARRFLDLVPPLLSKAPPQGASQAAQAEFLCKKLRVENLYPLLWNSRS